ncbi:glutathione S-transferase N-terminal domain-containing protein [Limnobacter parvus]|uniref:Glutathione S-transferase C-terminal domain-containing protein n=1 Tax=Limnobacter parvus TaxID=2939690 RepID=A0ABT1XHJ7_9BURK|nr:glutathione S-transferase N-terminal domain-containing protein [Limnobacter parvus]MCR2745564.1 glutathione S-transferase C-terminal domain-containing protein [Limnobacter parvus]
MANNPPTLPITFSGAPGSPYTRKMLALLRYRRMPYKYIVNNHLKAGLPAAKPALLPTFYFTNTEGETHAVTDSTPLIRQLEPLQETRHVVPPNPVVAMLDALLEDYFDEWLTKAMFHYRWAFKEDADRASRIVPLPMNIQIPKQTLDAIAGVFGERQVSRLGVVGSNAITSTLIEQSFVRLLELLEQHFTTHAFLMGKRPGASDFALQGQLSQLALFDPTPMALCCKIAPRVVAWAQLGDDLSGLEPTNSDWLVPTLLPAGLNHLLCEIGRTYVPVMLANEAALRQGKNQFNAKVDGLDWQQSTFPYQAKCVGWLRNSFALLNGEDQASFVQLIENTGCEKLFTETA